MPKERFDVLCPKCGERWQSTSKFLKTHRPGCPGGTPKMCLTKEEKDILRVNMAKLGHLEPTFQQRVHMDTAASRASEISWRKRKAG